MDRDWKLEGRCRCGQTRIEASAPPLLTMACHCTGCQRMSASAFSLSAAFPADGFRVTRGEPVLGGLKNEIHHFFCPECMTWMFTRVEGMDFFVNVRATMFDDVSWFTPFVETWTVEKLSWATTPAMHSFERLPDMAGYQALTEKYRETLRPSLTRAAPDPMDSSSK
jgi:hypothetical protein